MTIKANCKINIGLDIIARREDGFHEISTVMFPVKGLCDTLDIEPIDGGVVEFVGRGLVVDCDPSNNLCVKAYNLMKSLYPSISNVRITLDKQIPFGAGLGGGSADATAVIVAINDLFELALDDDKLMDLASQLGSDTAFFVRNTPQICSGRGEITSQIDIDLAGRYLLLVKPPINVSTKEAYSGVCPSLPAESLLSLTQLPLTEWQGRIKNDFEPHIFKAYPQLGQIKESMLSAGALYAAMSGSGSTLFGIFSDEQSAKSVEVDGSFVVILPL